MPRSRAQARFPRVSGLSPGKAFPGPWGKPGDQTAFVMDEDLVGMFALANGVQRVVVVSEPLLLAFEELPGRP